MHYRESFSLPYAGSELWYSCLDALKNNDDLIREKVLAEERLIRRPSTSSLVLYHLYDTIVNYALAEIIVNSLFRLEGSIQKLAVIGLSPEGRSNIKKVLRQSGLQINITTQYFDDFELAKEWLVKR